MIWPPQKAWTSKAFISGQRHFVAINYGGLLPDRWIILMSVLDSSVIVKVSWSQLVDTTNWECGWDEDDVLNSSELINKGEIRNTTYINPSIDSGLTIPITNDIIRPWFRSI